MTSQSDDAEQSLQNNPPRNTSSQSKTAQANIQDLQQPLSSPVEVQSNEKDDNANDESKAVNTASSKRSRKDLKDNPVLFTVNWICVVLGVAAAIVFGIWAPLSYEAAASGNRDSSAVQSSMISALSAANDLASSALSAASAQGTVLDEVQSRLGAMGQLALVGFCITETVGCVPIFDFLPRDHISRKSVLVRSTEGHTDCMPRVILGVTRLHLNPQRRRFLRPRKLPRNYHKLPRIYHFHFHTWRQYDCYGKGNHFSFDQSKGRTRCSPFISRSDPGNRIRCHSCPRTFHGDFRLATTQKSDNGWVGMRLPYVFGPCGGL